VSTAAVAAGNPLAVLGTAAQAVAVNGAAGPAGDCWNRIGIGGDGSCPALVEFIHCRNCPVFATAARSFFDRPAPAGYLDEWAGRLGSAAAEGPAEAAGVSLLLFRLGDDWLALDARSVVEVTEVRPSHRVPHRTNAVLVGLVNLRGQLHLCASLHGLLGVDPSAAGPAGRGGVPRMVVIRGADGPWVFAADEVLGVHKVAGDRLCGVPATLADPAVSYSQAVFDWGGRSVGYLDERRLFAGLRSLGR